MYYEAEKSQKNRCSITKNLKTPFSFAAAVSRNHKIITNNLFLKSKNETTNSPIHKFKITAKRLTSLLNPLYINALFLIQYFKNILSLAFSF